MTDCNVLIVGGGLSGSSAANHLERLGVKGVVVLERLSEGPHRRYHSICGEAVSDRMLRLSGFQPSRIVRRVESIEIVARLPVIAAQSYAVYRSAFFNKSLTIHNPGAITVKMFS